MKLSRSVAPVRSLVPALLLALLLLAAPIVTGNLHAQDFQYDVFRPDGRAPAGVAAGHVLKAGQFEARFDVHTIDGEGLLAGDLPVSFEDALALFPEVPATMSGMANALTLMYAPSDRLTLLGSVSYTQMDIGHWTRNEQAFFTESGSLGDLRVSGLFNVYEKGPYRAHVDLGVSVPTGSIDESDITPSSFPSEGQLPYVMQTGSGTFDALPGLTLHVQNENGAVGGQIRGTLRFGENDRGYRLGDRMMGTAWIAPRINEFIGLTARFVFESWDGVSGADAALDENQVPTAVASFTGGTRAEVPFGLNFYMAEGMLQGHRVGVEVSFPVHQDYDGIQLERKTTAIFSWQKVF